MSAQRRERKKTKADKEMLLSLVNSFFNESIKCLKEKGKRDDIRAIYNKHRSSWSFYCNKTVYAGVKLGNTKVASKEITDNAKAEILLMIDSFDSAFTSADVAIINTSKHAGTALAMLRVLRYVQDKNKITCFMREFPFWVKHIFRTFITIRNKKQTEIIAASEMASTQAGKMGNTPAPPLRATVTERKVA